MLHHAVIFAIKGESYRMKGPKDQNDADGDENNACPPATASGGGPLTNCTAYSIFKTGDSYWPNSGEKLLASQRIGFIYNIRKPLVYRVKHNIRLENREKIFAGQD